MGLRNLFAPSRKDSQADPVGRAMRGVNGYWKQLTGAQAQAGEHRQIVGGLWDQVGQLQFDFLKSQGLQPQHTLVDIGCGALRGGVHFVRYLDSGHYFGLDVNQSLLDAGELELRKACLSDRNARLLVSNRFDISRFGVQFDYAIAVSVFTHLYLNHILRCLMEAQKALKPGGKLFATFFEAPTCAHPEPISQALEVTSHWDIDPFHYSVSEMRAAADLAGLQLQVIGEWAHPRNQRMLCFERPVA